MWGMGWDGEGVLEGGREGPAETLRAAPIHAVLSLSFQETEVERGSVWDRAAKILSCSFKGQILSGASHTPTPLGRL